MRERTYGNSWFTESGGAAEGWIYIKRISYDLSARAPITAIRAAIGYDDALFIQIYL